MGVENAPENINEVAEGHLQKILANFEGRVLHLLTGEIQKRLQDHVEKVFLEWSKGGVEYQLEQFVARHVRDSVGALEKRLSDVQRNGVMDQEKFQKQISSLSSKTHELGEVLKVAGQGYRKMESEFATHVDQVDTKINPLLQFAKTSKEDHRTLTSVMMHFKKRGRKIPQGCPTLKIPTPKRWVD